jgi:HEAT repeat protein
MRPFSISVVCGLTLALLCPASACPESAAKLIKQLKSLDPGERAQAAWDLGEMGAAEAVDALARALEDEDAAVRANAAGALGSLGEAARPAMPALEAALADEEPYVVGNAAWALDGLGVPPRELEAAYRRLLAEPDCVHRVRALRGLLDLVPPAELFAAALDCSRNAEDFDDRSAAVDLLHRLIDDDREMVPLMLAALERSGAADVSNVARALAAFKPPVLEAVPALAGLLSSSNAGNRAAGARALGRIGPAAQDAVPALSRTLASDADPEVREVAAAAIGDVGRGARGAVPDLMAAAAGDKYPKVKQAAMRSLGEMGGDAKTAIPMLQEALRDADGFTRLAARNALFRIDPEHKEEAAYAADATASAIQSATVDLMTEATGVAQALAGKQAVEVVLYHDFAMATVPAGGGYEQYTYRGGTVTGPESGTSTCDKAFRIADADFSLVPKMAREAPGLVGAPGAPISHVVLGGGVFCGKASWLVYVGEGARIHGYVVFKLNGKVSKVQKF